MQFSTNYSAGAVSEASTDERAAFIVRTYLHLFAALGAFVCLIALWFVTPVAGMVISVLQYGRFGMLLFLGAFMGVSMLADRWARSDTSVGMQYLGLGLYTVAESLIFVPLIALALMAMAEGDTMILPKAGLVTMLMFASLTAIVFVTRKDFSFLRGVLMFGGMAALVIVVMSLIFGFTLGAFFTYAMIALACGYILFDTSNVLHHYRTDQHVAAALALFSAVALLLWYVLRLLLSRRN